MKELTFEEIKEIELNILINFDDFCKKNNLEYFLSFGTLLGAIRHNGFIPWDDDIDVCMKREDYNKLIELAHKDRCISGSININLPLDKNYLYPIIKLTDDSTLAIQELISKKHQTGVWIDIFPLDYLPDDEKQYNNLKKKSMFYRRLWSVSYISQSESKIKFYIKKIYNMVANIFHINSHFWVKKMLKLPYTYKGKRMGTYVMGLCHGNTLQSSFLEETTLHTFEKHQFVIPQKYQDVLKCNYGEDYMQLPPLDKRINHSIRAYKKE